MRSLWNNLFHSLVLFYVISDAFSQRIRVSGSHVTMLISHTKIKSCTTIVDCTGDASASKGWTIVYLIGGDRVGNCFLQEFVFTAKSFV